MNTQQTNRLIAERDPKMELFRNHKFKIEYWTRAGTIERFREGDLEYHSSIEWLYPVARKVKEELLNLRVSRFKNGGDLVLDGIAFNLSCAGSDFTIESLYPAVVEAIEFLNKHKEDKQ